VGEKKILEIPANYSDDKIIRLLTKFCDEAKEKDI